MSYKLSIECNAPEKAIHRIQKESNQQRSQFILDVFVKYFGDGIKKNPKDMNGKFRKMAKTPFNFYRGSTNLFYQDLKVDRDEWIYTNKAAGQVFIHVCTYTD
jgi:hypothetical protein